METENSAVMDTEKTEVNESTVKIGTLKAFGNKLTDAGNYALLLASVLIGIWCVGRVFEAFSLRTVFEANLVYWMVLCIWILLGTFVVGSAVHYIQRLAPHLKERNVIGSWVFFGILIAAVVCVIQGYRFASMNFFAIMAGTTEPAQQSLFQMFKFFPATPILPVSLLATKAAGVGIEITSLMPFVWNSSWLFVFFVWSIVYGALLLRMPGEKPLHIVKVVHLVVSLAGMVIMMMLKSIFTFTEEYLISLHAFVIVLFVSQILLTYSSLRFAAGDKNEDEDIKYSKPLPPSALKVALFLIIIFPILTDLQNQFVMSTDSRPIIKELAADQSKVKAKYVTASMINQ
jgi:hypothetical protein